MIWKFVIVVMAIAGLAVSFAFDHMFALPVQTALRAQGATALLLAVLLFLNKSSWLAQWMAWGTLLLPFAFLYPYLSYFEYFMWYDQVTMGLMGAIGVFVIFMTRKHR